MTIVLDEKNKEMVSAPEVPATQDAEKHPLLEYLKELPITSVTPELKERYQATTQLLTQLIKEVEAKRAAIRDKKKTVQEKLDSLRSLKSVTIGENEFNRSKESTDKYVALLDKMIAEIERDRDFYISLVSENPPKTVMVLKFETDDFEKHLEQRILAIKKHVKNTTRDLSVSFSRYSFGLDTQINHLNYVELVAKNRAKDLPSK